MARIKFQGGNVFDGTGAAIRRDDVVIDDATIVGLGTDIEADEIIDVSGLTVLPGFIDTHVHIMVKGFDVVDNLNQPFSYQYYLGAENLSKILDIGITTIRDASGADLGVQRALEDGLIEGPQMEISIIALSQTGGHGDFTMPSGRSTGVFMETPNRPSAIIDGPEEARKRVRELVRSGANAIKVNTSGGVISPRTDPKTAHLSFEEIEMIVREARRAGIPVMAHSHGTEAIKVSVQAGVSSIEHGTMLDDETIEMMVEKGTWLIPTLAATQGIIDQLDSGVVMAPGIAEKARSAAELRKDSFARALEAGVKIAMGSDSVGVGNGSNLNELRLLNEMGMEPLAALKAATQSAAEVLGKEDTVGSIRAGLQADLLLVEGDPFDFAAYPGNIRAVYQRGKLVRDYSQR